MTATPPTVLDPTTGEVRTLADVNNDILQLGNQLEAAQPEMDRLFAECSQVTLRYDLEYAAAVKTSSGRSEDVRKADALAHVSTATLPDSPVPLAYRKAELEMRIRAMRDGMHNLRARMDSLRTVSANLRTEVSTLGYRT